MEKEEMEKKKEQVQSAVHRLIDILEAHGYWVWSASKSYEPDGLITLSVSPNRKN
jgi:hypothetical protein